MEKFLIVNADDFGYGAERDAGILDCFKRGAITNVSLMVNGVNAENAAKLGVQHNLPMGLHLNITEGSPVGPGPYKTLVNQEGFFHAWYDGFQRGHSRGENRNAGGLHLNITEGSPVGPGPYKTLVNQDGFFHGMMGFREVTAAGKIDMQEVKAEIQAQIDQFAALVGHKPDSVDGHQHVHVDTEIAPVFASVMQQNGIQLTRLPVETGVSDFDFPSPWGTEDTAEVRRYFMTQLVEKAKAAKEVYDSNKLLAPAFTGLRTMGRDMTIPCLQAFITEVFDQSQASQPVCELMCHPGNKTGNVGGCGDGPDTFSQSDDRVYEMDLLCSEAMKTFYTSNKISLISFKDSLKYLQ